MRSMDSFAVLAEPTRRRILDELRHTESSVGDLVTALQVSQPTMSKHLKVLREAGFVSVRIAAQQRVYRMCKEEGLKREEVAERMKISPQTVKIQLGHAMRSIRAWCLARIEWCLIPMLLAIYL